MTITSLLLGTISAQVLFVITKIIFINYLNISSWTVVILFYVALAIITIAISRRMGTLNYFEGILLVVVWTIIGLIADIVVTTHFTGRSVYASGYFWLTYVLIGIVLFVFHKKIHVEARRSNNNQ